MTVGEEIAKMLGEGWVYELHEVFGRKDQIWLRYKADWQLIITVEVEQVKVAFLDQSDQGPMVYVSWPRSHDGTANEEGRIAIQRAMAVMKGWIGLMGEVKAP